MSGQTGLTGTASRAGIHRVQVVGRVQTAREVVTLWLALPGTLQAPAPYKPGQFVTLALPSDRGTLYRSYSLCGDGSADRPWEITVKRQHAGLVSSYIYDRVASGMILYVSAPAGSFVLPEPLRPGQPIVFVALGSGITPIYGMLRALARLAPERRPRVQLHYAYSSPADAIYGRELAQLDPRREWLAQSHYMSSTGGRLTVEHVLALAGPHTVDAEWYICGSAEFKRALDAALVRRGVAQGQIHAEMFASPRIVEARAPSETGVAGDTARVVAAAARVRLADEDRVLSARPGETLLEVLERHGYRPDFSCRVGACGTCRLRLLSGHVSQAGGGLSSRERAQGYVLSCVAQPLGDVTLASAGAPAVAAGEVAAGVAAGAAVRAGGTRSRGRRGARTALRWTLAAASVALFAQTWAVTSSTQTAQAASSDGGQPATTIPCSNSRNDDEHEDDHHDGGAQCATPTPTPSGPSSISTSPTFPSPPSTSSGSSR
jgi:ferredoxin-NADP reductase